MLSFLSGSLFVVFLVYAAVAVANWYEWEEIECWYCRVLKALNWPYDLYKEYKD